MSAINYDLTRIKGFVFDIDGVLSPSTIPLGEDGYPRRMANIKDGYALQLAIKKGYHIAIITGGKGIGVVERFKSLGITDLYINCSVKKNALLDWLDKTDLKPEEIAFMGDDIPDLPCMRIAGLSATPFDGCFEAKSTASYVSPFLGGYGCVRDIIEQTLKASGEWMNDEECFKW